MVSEDFSADEVQSVAKQVESYLSARSGAADTIDGVIQWWLMRQRIIESEQLTKLAVETLLQKGLIQKKKLIDGTELYYSSSSSKGETEKTDV